VVILKLRDVKHKHKTDIVSRDELPSTESNALETVPSKVNSLQGRDFKKPCEKLLKKLNNRPDVAIGKTDLRKRTMSSIGRSRGLYKETNQQGFKFVLLSKHAWL
jgi:hypothetical protein